MSKVETRPREASAQAALADGSAWRYTYDALGQVTSGKRFWNDNTEVAGQQFGYQYDGIGNRTSITTNGRAATYTANALNQYSQRTVPGAVDVIGEAAPAATVTVNDQPTVRKNGYYYAEADFDNSAAPVYPAITVKGTAGTQSVSRTGNVFVPKATETFTYDDDGNQTSDGRWTNTWDGENRLIAQETTAAAVAAGAPKQMLVFRYEDQCRRATKATYLWNVGTNAWESSRGITLLYDHWNLVAESATPNQLARGYVWGLDISGTEADAGGIGGLVLETSFDPTGPANYFPAFDGIGNLTAMVRTTDGHPRQIYGYGPFGESIRTSTAGPDTNPFQWSTKFTDEETGMIYYGYRFHRTDVGRWLKRDPIGERGGFNLYGFCLNEPVSHIDKLGEFTIGRTCKCCMDNDKQKKWMSAIDALIRELASAGAGDRKAVYNLQQYNLTVGFATKMRLVMLTVTANCLPKALPIGWFADGIGIPGADSFNLYGACHDDVNTLVNNSVHEMAHVAGKVGHGEPDSPYYWGAWADGPRITPPRLNPK